ncbi:peptidoglycan D,D-transpeptidase FtsI family protein [Kordiimonas laminariae]|uniref:peptidoglycan D,D-transpeptidase FtsI family protein n=1 Tax=Kordiimonas laminariae TaxID=2917717 RepID=UPI001FF6571F|nr:penicillin-binding protein 2 [Kordiimonas laminariae]MCK0068667.1 penicillin-binding protein 2 [Kordiimonas laminariae]
MTTETHRRSAIEIARNRLMIGVVLFCFAFLIMIGRTIELGVSAPKPRVTATRQVVTVPEVQIARADIVDRNGEILATNLETASLYAVPKDIKDPQEAARQLVSILPELSYADVEAKLSSGKKFVWLKRKLTPRQKWEVNAIGEPAFQFEREEERIYPHGRLAAHVLGYVDVDGNGLGGVEHFFDAKLGDKSRTSEQLQLSLDIRVQYALADELQAAMRAYQAIGGAGLVMDVSTGEVIAMVSLPDYDPNNVRGVADTEKFNRATKGVYELGSTFKTFTFANALDDGVVSMEDGYDATKPLRISRFLIRDDHPKERYLTVPEIFTFSSNIGTAQMALDIGTERQQEFLGELGLLQPANVELTEVGAPLVPPVWRKSSTMTISYGHGLAVSPLQLASGISAMVNGGRLMTPTLVHNPENWQTGKQVIAPDTSRKIRQLLRMAVTKGTGGRADAVGYRVGGKTGTAEKAIAGGYARKKLISSFMGVFPMDDPQYAVFALLDEPKGTKETFGYRSGGWVAAPVVRNVILRSAPLLGVSPKQEDAGLYQDVALLIEDKKKK